MYPCRPPVTCACAVALQAERLHSLLRLTRHPACTCARIHMRMHHVCCLQGSQITLDKADGEDPEVSDIKVLPDTASLADKLKGCLQVRQATCPPPVSLSAWLLGVCVQWQWLESSGASAMGVWEQSWGRQG